MLGVKSQINLDKIKEYELQLEYASGKEKAKEGKQLEEELEKMVYDKFMIERL